MLNMNAGQSALNVVPDRRMMNFNRPHQTSLSHEPRSNPMKRQQGFTLIELIVVIVILGVLAATAVPKFVDLQSDARAAVMKGVGASMNSAKELVRARWLANGSTAATTVNLDVGNPVTVDANGYPTADAAGIEAAITVPTEVVWSGTRTATYGTFAGCTAAYAAGGAVTVAASADTCR
jgi:MSHA pilin protein MshA